MFARAPLSLSMLAWVVFVTTATAGGDASAQEPPGADRRKEQAQRGQVALGFDPELAREAQRERKTLQVSASELGLTPQDDGSSLYVDPHLRFSARFMQDGTVQFADPWRRPSAHNERGVCCGRPLRFSFPNTEMSGPTEWLMYLSDQEPLRREKAQLLEKTRTFRAQLAIAFARRNIAQALGRLEAELFDIWSDPKLDERARRALIFARWDECDERFGPTTGNVPAEALSVIDGERLAAADRARREIEAFIRKIAPRGSSVAYSSTELEALNAQRSSRQDFDPYTPRPAAPTPASAATQAKATKGGEAEAPAPASSTEP